MHQDFMMCQKLTVLLSCTAYMYVFRGWLITKEHIAQSKKLEEIKIFLIFAPKENNSIHKDEDGTNHLKRAWLFLFIFIFVSYFGFMGNIEDEAGTASSFWWRQHMFSVMLASDLQQPCGSQFKSLHQSLLAIVGMLLEVEKKQCPFEACLWTLHEPLGIM